MLQVFSHWGCLIVVVCYCGVVWYYYIYIYIYMLSVMVLLWSSEAVWLDRATRNWSDSQICLWFIDTSTLISLISCHYRSRQDFSHNFSLVDWTLVRFLSDFVSCTVDEFTGFRANNRANVMAISCFVVYVSHLIRRVLSEGKLTC